MHPDIQDPPAAVSLIRAERTAGRLTITLDRAAKANALTAQMMLDLAGAVRRAEPGDIVVLQSASPTLFCAGADIAEFVSGADALAVQEEGLLAMIEALAACPAPIVAVARGRAAGGGAILLCLADVVVAAEDLRIVCPEFMFGMYPIIVEAVLQSRIGPALTSRLCLGAGSLGAHEGYTLGLLAEVLPAEGFAAAAAARLEWYAERDAGLQALRRSRLAGTATDQMLRQVHAVAPLMLANFGAPGVRERIGAYLAGLKHGGR